MNLWRLKPPFSHNFFVVLSPNWWLLLELPLTLIYHQRRNFSSQSHLPPFHIDLHSRLQPSLKHNWRTLERRCHQLGEPSSCILSVRCRFCHFPTRGSEESCGVLDLHGPGETYPLCRTWVLLVPGKIGRVRQLSYWFGQELKEVSVKRFTSELHTAVKNHSNLSRFFGVIYPVVGDIPHLAILSCSFFCRNLLSIATGNQITHERQVVLSVVAVGLLFNLLRWLKAISLLSGNVIDSCLNGKGIS